MFVASQDDGMMNIGLTDQMGQISIAEEVLTRPRNLAVLFCKVGFICGAVRLGSPMVLSIKHRLIDLAPFSIK